MESVDVPEQPVPPPEVEKVAEVAVVPENPPEPIQHQFLPEDNEVTLAKAFLTSKVGVKSPISVYDHITNIIMKSLEQRDKNIVDNFEQISLNLKKSLFSVDPNAPTTAKDVYEEHNLYSVAKSRLDLLKKKSADEPAEGEMGEIPDIMDLASLWEWAGISFGKQNTFLLFLSIKKLVEEKQLKSVRLWGKVWGTESNYIIVEAELRDGANDDEDAIVNAPIPVETEKVEKKEAPPAEGEPPKPDTADSKLPPVKEKKFAPLSRELRSGANKYIYYVCSYIGGQWKRLPDVLPERLQEARKIRKYFTGRLDAPIVSYPPFKGNEAQYLRCQIARISSATVISPKGYYMIDPDAEDPDENPGNAPIIINPEYEGTPNEQLLSTGNWVHHVPYILPQGRVQFEAPKQIKEEAENEEKDEEEEEEEETAVEPETGPPVLTPISSDEDLGSSRCWTSRVCSNLSLAKYSPITLRSNRWPGASVLAYNDKFANIYIGDGQRELGNPAQSFIPPPLGPIQKEYGIGEGTTGNLELLVEQLDPTVEAEVALEEEMKAKEEVKEEGAEEEEGEEE